jgi:transposase
LRPAESADLLRGRFKECFSPFVTSWTAPCASGWSGSSPGRVYTDVSTAPSQGAPNNHAERTLRRFVIWRKRSFGTQSARGSRYVERIMTVAGSCRLQGRNVLDFLTQAIAAHRGHGSAPSLVPA